MEWPTCIADQDIDSIFCMEYTLCEGLDALQISQVQLHGNNIGLQRALSD